MLKSPSSTQCRAPINSLGGGGGVTDDLLDSIVESSGQHN